MRQMLMVVALVLLPAVRASPAQKPCSLPWALESVTVAGKDSPEWHVWLVTFEMLKFLEGKDSAHTQYLTNLTTEETAVLYDEARLQTKRDAVHREKLEELRKRMPEATPAQWLEATTPLVLEYRWTILDARDRVLDAFSPESERALEHVLTNARNSSETCVPKAELALFKLPG